MDGICAAVVDCVAEGEACEVDGDCCAGICCAGFCRDIECCIDEPNPNTPAGTDVAVDIPTIELAGGSVRCMIAGIHLDRRPPLAQAELTEAVEAINEDNPVTPDGRFVN